MTTFRSHQPGSGVTPHPTPELRWCDLDAIDRSWSGVSYVRAFVGFDVPSVDAVRDALRELGRARSEIGRWTAPGTTRWRPVADEEYDDWLDEVLTGAAHPGADVEHAFAVNTEPLGRTPFRFVIGPDWLSVRMTHAMGDGWTSLNFVGHVLRSATEPGVPIPWTPLSQRRRDGVIARATARNLPTLVSAVRHRAELAGGVYEPAAERADRMPDLTRALTSGTGFGAELRAVRDRWFPGASAAAVAMVGLRTSFDQHLPPSRPGFECLFNTRVDATANCWGNWSAGVYIRPADDCSPAAVAAEMGRVRTSGLPELAHLSLRVRGRRAGGGAVTMPRPEGSPRLTMSYTQSHHVDPVLPGIRPGESVVATLSRPNGVESVTVQAVECAGRLTVGLSFFPDVWPEDAACRAVTEFLADPAAVLERVRETERR